jgi:hypothetical protein
MGENNIAKITSPVLLIAGDNDGLDKIELIKTYQLLGGAVSADLEQCQNRNWPLFLRRGMSA